MSDNSLLQCVKFLIKALNETRIWWLKIMYRSNFIYFASYKPNDLMICTAVRYSASDQHPIFFGGRTPSYLAVGMRHVGYLSYDRVDHCGKKRRLRKIRGGSLTSLLYLVSVSTNNIVICLILGLANARSSVEANRLRLTIRHPLSICHLFYQKPIYSAVPLVGYSMVEAWPCENVGRYDRDDSACRIGVWVRFY